MRDIKSILESKGHKVVRVGDNWNINCPFCGENRKRLGFAMTTGAWNCFNCDERGKSFQSFMKKQHGTSVKASELKLEKYSGAAQKEAKIDQARAHHLHEKLDDEKRTAKIFLMQERGFKEETINHFILGSFKKNGREFVSIPFFEHGKLVNFKYRQINVDDKKFKWIRHKGGKSTLFNHDVIEDKQWNTIFICEAEMDAIALWNAGFKNVVSVPAGAKGVRPQWYDRFQEYKKVFLVYDNDVDGQNGAFKMASRVGLDKCYNVNLPEEIKDVNEFFWDKDNRTTRHTKKDFEQLVKKSKQFSVPDSVTLGEAFEQLHHDMFVADEDEVRGLLTPWKKISNLIEGGTKPGMFVVVTGKPKVGKTTWVLNWMMHIAEREKTPVGMYNCEMKPKVLAEKVFAMKNKFPKLQVHTNKDIEDRKRMIALAEAKYMSPTDKVVFLYPENSVLDLDDVCEKITNVVKRYGCKFFCFDNLHFLVRGDNVKDRVGEVTRRFKLLAETLDIVFCLVVHPRKVGGKFVKADDLKDSSSTYQDLDTLVILNRFDDVTDPDEEEVQNPTPLIYVNIEGRFCEKGQTRLLYEGNRGLFHDNGTKYLEAVGEADKKKKQRQKKAKGS